MNMTQALSGLTDIMVWKCFSDTNMMIIGQVVAVDGVRDKL